MINIHRYGDGPRLFVGLHGWSGDHRAFAPLAALMPADASLLALDLPGCGRSPRPERWEIDAIARDVAVAVREAIARQGGRSATLVGNCSGGLIGLQTALHAEAAFKRIVLIDPFAYFPWYFRLFTLGEFGRRAYLSTFSSRLGRMLTDRTLSARRSASTSLTASFAEVDHETTLRYLRLLTQIDEPNRYAGIQAGVEIVTGERTFGAVHRSVELWKGVWPDARTHRLPGAGHLPIEEAPEALARIVFDGDDPERTVSVDRAQDNELTATARLDRA